MKKIKITDPIKDMRGKTIKDERGKDLTKGDMLLNLLSQNIKLKENKESFWVTEIGIQIAEGKNEIELSEDKFAFVKRVVDENKFRVNNVEQDYYLPYILGQMMALFVEGIAEVK